MHNNPAARYLDIVKKGQGQTATDTCSAAWSNILNVPQSDTAKLLKRISSVLYLPSEIKAGISILEGQNTELLLKWMPNVVNTSKDINFMKPWSHYNNVFTGEVVYGIEICADTLSRLSPEKVIEDDVLSEIQTKIEELIQDIENDSISDFSKRFILSSLLKLKDAIEEIPICGLKGVENSYGQVIGNAIIHRDKDIKSEDSKSAKKLWEILGRIAIAFSIATGPIALKNEIVDMLPAQTEVKQEIAASLPESVEV